MIDKQYQKNYPPTKVQGKLLERRIRIIRKLRLNKERLCGNLNAWQENKTDKLVPVYTLVVYWGTPINLTVSEAKAYMEKQQV